MAHDVFLSYSYQDKVSADAVCHSLEAKGIRCWMAPRDVIPGDDWQQSLMDAIAAARAVILLFTAHTNQSENVKKEVSAAVDANTIVIPFFIEDVKPLGALKYHLSGVHWLDAYSPPLEEHVAHLASILKNLTPRPGETPPTIPSPPPPPAPPPPAPPPLAPGAPATWQAVSLDRREGFAFLAAVIPFVPGLYLLWRDTYRPDGGRAKPVGQGRKIGATILAVLLIVVMLAVLENLVRGRASPPIDLSSSSASAASASSAATSAAAADSGAASSSADQSSASGAPWTAVSTDGKDRKIKFINQSSHTIYHIYAWTTDQTEADGHDLMPEADVIPTGQSLTYTVDDGGNHCNYSFKATRADNAPPIFVSNVEVCGTEQVPLND